MFKHYDAILVGGSGFIGSPLGKILSKKGERVVSISRHRSARRPEADELILDVADSVALTKSFPVGEVVYILIGQNNPHFDGEQELTTLKSLIVVLNQRRPKKVFYLSSALIYGETEEPATESAPCKPEDQYSRFKYAAEELLRRDLDQRILLGIVRLANVYGGQKNRGFVGLVISRLLRGNDERLIVNGDGLQERDYIFIDDAVSAIASVAKMISHTDIVNIATGKSYTLLALLDQVFRITGRSFPYEKNDSCPAEVKKSRISNEKLSKDYRFLPTYSFETGLRETYARSAEKTGRVSGKKILLLGGEGFIGRNLAAHFSQSNECFSIGLTPSIFTDRQDTFIQADPYRDRIDQSYDIIIHLIDNKIPYAEFEKQERRLLECLVLKTEVHLVLFSSAVVYVNPDSEYGKRKRCLEDFYVDYCTSHGITLTVFRPFNLFGSYQLPYRPGSLVANLMYNFLLGKSTEINDLETKRDFMHAGDIGKFVEHALLTKRVGTFDMGSGSLVHIRDLISHLDHEVSPQKIKIIDKQLREGVSDYPANQAFWSACPMVDFDEGLKQIILFYRDNLHLLKDYVERKSE